MSRLSKEKKKQQPERVHIASQAVPSMKAPAFNPTASPVQQKSEKKQVHDVPEPTGKAQEGPLGVKGFGDDHQFSVNDINQGSIGDCFFLAGLGAVANSNPELIEKAIKDNKDGTYTVTLYSPKSKDIGEARPDQGTNSWFTKLTPRTITVNAEMPTAVNGYDTANYNDLSSTKPHAMGGDRNNKGQLEQWVRIIEKAYAVLNGGYDVIGNGGYTEAAMEALTGKQFSEKVVRSKKSLKRQLINAMEKGQPATVSTGYQSDIDGAGEEYAKFAEENDIVGGHAYMVLEADENGIKLRNPWGSAAINPEPYLTWDQFTNLFSQIGVQK